MHPTFDVAMATSISTDSSGTREQSQLRSAKATGIASQEPMGDMLTEMQGCSKQLCGNSAAGNPEAVAQLIAEKMAAMNIRQGPDRLQDSYDDVPALPALVQMAAADAHVGAQQKVHTLLQAIDLLQS